MRSQRGFVLACALTGTLALAGSAAADTDIQGNPNGLPDLDVRAGKLAPTAAQRTDVRDLGAQVAWNQFGTPSSLVRPGGALGATVQGSSASDAARAWLSSNRSLFRLSSTQGLALVSDNALAGGATHAVTLRQTIDGLAASGGGMVTIGVTKAGSAWKVVSASSSLNGDRTLDGKARLRDGQAWQAAAASVGRVKSLAQIARLRGKAALGHGWKGLRVAGLGDVQQARQVAFPTVSHGYVPAYETLVLDTQAADPTAYRVFVDARSGTVLARESLVDSEGDTAAAAPPTTQINGTLPPEDGGCDTQKGPFTVAAGDGVRAIDVSANADSVSNDIVLKLFNGTTEVAEADTVRTPERIRYAPDGGVPAGDYFVQLCEFKDGQPPVEPRTYTGTISFDTSAPARALHRALAREPGQPAAQPAALRSVEQPEHGHPREHVLEAEHDPVGLRHGRRQPRVALAVGLQPARQRLPPSRPRATTRARRSRGRTAASPGPTSSTRSARPATTPSRGPTSGSPRTAIPARPTARTSRSARASTSPRRR